MFYLLTLAPLLVGQLCNLPVLLSKSAEDRDRLTKLMVKGRYSQDITINNLSYMFVHYDLDHLSSNLQLMALCGYRVYRHFPGISVFYASFLGGGVCASTEGGWGMLEKSLQFTGNEEARNSLHEIFRQGGAMVKKTTNNVMDYFSFTMGSSAGVSALIGSGFVLDMKWIMQELNF